MEGFQRENSADLKNPHRQLQRYMIFIPLETNEEGVKKK